MVITNSQKVEGKYKTWAKQGSNAMDKWSPSSDQSHPLCALCLNREFKTEKFVDNSISNYGLTKTPYAGSEGIMLQK